MKCFVCNGMMKHFLYKDFPDFNVKGVDYVRCTICGFVVAETLVEMPEYKWRALNEEFHGKYQGGYFDSNDPSWIARLRVQSGVIAELAATGILNTRLPWLDYGCGDGKLSDMLEANHGIHLVKYEPYMSRKGCVKQETLNPGSYGMVVSTSVFEHLRGRFQLDGINSLVAGNGAMAIHTLVAEEIPQDSDWFYFLPVHCAIFTNKSMQVLFDAWGYTASIYQVEARLWVWFRGNADEVEQKIALLNEHSGTGLHYAFKRGFVDYWKLSVHDVMRRT